MSSFIIKGGNKLEGTVSPIPNKNSILKLIPAAVLADEPVTFHNVPKSSSVRIMLRIFRKLGGKVAYTKKGSVRLDPTTLDKYTIPENLAKKERAPFVYLGPLLSKFKKAQVGDSGGCSLGDRPLDSIFQGLKALGVKVDKSNGYKLETNGLTGKDPIWLLEASVTGTENLILAAVKARGKTVIYNAACEPHTQDLCNFLVSIGADIKGIGTNKLEINGVSQLTGGTWTVIPDHVDIGGLIAAALITKGELEIKNAITEHMYQILKNYEKLGAEFKIKANSIYVPPNQKLVCKSDFKGNINKVKAEPWPGFPVDLIPQMVVLALFAQGSIKIFNQMYETGLYFVRELLKMKAKLVLADPHRVVTFGPSALKGSTVPASSILQCGHAMVLAALGAEGETKILNTDIIARRYPDLVDRLSALGADIKEVR